MSVTWRENDKNPLSILFSFRIKCIYKYNILQQHTTFRIDCGGITENCREIVKPMEMYNVLQIVGLLNVKGQNKRNRISEFYFQLWKNQQHTVILMIGHFMLLVLVLFGDRKILNDFDGIGSLLFILSFPIRYITE